MTDRSAVRRHRCKAAGQDWGHARNRYPRFGNIRVEHVARKGEARGARIETGANDAQHIAAARSRAGIGSDCVLPEDRVANRQVCLIRQAADSTVVTADHRISVPVPNSHLAQIASDFAIRQRDSPASKNERSAAVAVCGNGIAVCDGAARKCRHAVLCLRETVDVARIDLFVKAAATPLQCRNLDAVGERRVLNRRTCALCVQNIAADLVRRPRTAFKRAVRDCRSADTQRRSRARGRIEKPELAIRPLVDTGTGYARVRDQKADEPAVIDRKRT